ncbi:unnamed protein product [Rotaria sp. Silwood2]|nr:unnamed protein product [Rotaria sp. Silwood2]CAF2789627.1 unnamed protein product [Rotaria sp. Silwood2]CAF2847651.1 unnamed protein product [Rotaria sp. Silwood2]CAF3251220.1 unnamed protein product [Rotaria sp. Silwood2]CAF4081373.1 unnamed protein product [Rotaria sp. Silwood2]
MNDKHQQSNGIRTFCKKYNIELQDKPILASNSQPEQIENNESLGNDTSNDDGVLTVTREQNNSQQLSDQIRMLQSPPISPRQQSSSKQKANEVHNCEQSLTKNHQPTKKPARATCCKR